MVDNRFKDYPLDARFPVLGEDARFPGLAVDEEFPTLGAHTRFEGDTYAGVRAAIANLTNGFAQPSKRSQMLATGAAFSPESWGLTAGGVDFGTGEHPIAGDMAANLGSQIHYRGTFEAEDFDVSATIATIPSFMGAPTVSSGMGAMTVDHAASPAANGSAVTQIDIRYSAGWGVPLDLDDYLDPLNWGPKVSVYRDETVPVGELAYSVASDPWIIDLAVESGPAAVCMYYTGNGGATPTIEVVFGPAPEDMDPLTAVEVIGPSTTGHIPGASYETVCYLNAAALPPAAQILVFEEYVGDGLTARSSNLRIARAAGLAGPFTIDATPLVANGTNVGGFVIVTMTSPSIVEVGGTQHLFFLGWNGTPATVTEVRVFMITSTDGFNTFTAPVQVTTPIGMEGSVVEINGKYFATSTADDPLNPGHDAIFLASSDTVDSGYSTPVRILGKGGGLDAKEIIGAQLVTLNGSSKIFYTGVTELGGWAVVSVELVSELTIVEDVAASEFISVPAGTYYVETAAVNGVGRGPWGSLAITTIAEELVFNGLMAGLAVPSQRAGTYVPFPSGVTEWLTWSLGVGSYGDTTYGSGVSESDATAATPSDATASIGVSLLFEALGNDGKTYRADALIAAEPGAATAPDWSIVDAATGGAVTVTITSEPANNSAAFTEIEYQIDGGAWASLTSQPGTGDFPITGLANGVQVSVNLRWVNAAGAGAASDGKAVTPTDGTASAPETVGTIANQIWDRGINAPALDVTGNFTGETSIELGPSSDPLPGGVTFVAGVFNAQPPTEASLSGEAFQMAVRGVNGGLYSDELFFSITVNEILLELVSLTDSTITVQSENNTGTIYWGWADAALSDDDLIAGTGGDVMGNFPTSAGSDAMDLSSISGTTKVLSVLQVASTPANARSGRIEVSRDIAAGATAPSPFGSGDWSLVDLATGGAANIVITALPADGGSALTSIEYKADIVFGGGTWTELTGSPATGTYPISGLTDDVVNYVSLRAVNAIGASAASSKSETITGPPVSADPAYIAHTSETNDFGSSAEAFDLGAGALTGLANDSKVAVGLALMGGQDPLATSVTIGGVAATMRQQSTSGGSVDASAAIWEATASGAFSTDEVVVTPDAALDDSLVIAWDVTGLTYQGGDATDINGTSNDLTLNLTNLADDAVIGIGAFASNSSGNATFSAGLTDDANAPVSFGGREAVFGQNNAATANQTVTVSTTATGDHAFVAAFYR